MYKATIQKVHPKVSELTITLSINKPNSNGEIKFTWAGKPMSSENEKILENIIIMYSPLSALP